MNDESLTRRTLLVTLGAVGTVSLAGCPSSSEEVPDEGDTPPATASDSPTAEATPNQATSSTQTTTPTETPQTATPTVTDTPSADGAVQLVREFYTAASNGDFERANSLIHPDSPEGTITEEQQAVFERQTVDVQDTSVVERTDRQASVNATLVFSRDGQERTNTVALTLRKDNDEWKLYSLE
ncbi:hypothetical protein [Salinibaculum salinum]|uniref:hypothetical protein n=1 Tax=Salinibaculum salinum TaxID=3131996 RepID=UPI0030EE1CB5